MNNLDQNLESRNSGSQDPWDEPIEEYRVYSKEEMNALRKANPRQFSAFSAWFVVMAQVLLTLLIALMWAIFSGLPITNVYTESALVGGLIGFLPSGLFLLRLEFAKKSPQPSSGSYLAAIVSGEFIKIAVTIMLFVGFAIRQPDLQWIPLLITYLATLKCYWFAWLWR